MLSSATANSSSCSVAETLPSCTGRPYLGSIWLVVSPVISAGLLSFVFGRVAHLSSGGVPYFAFTFAGLLAWNLFSSSVTGASSSLVSNSNLFTRIYFPRMLLPLSAMAPNLVNTGISCGVMFVLLVAYKIGFSFRLLLLPVWLGLAFLLSVGVSLMLSSLAVLRRDVQYATQVVMPLLLFVTPVAYSVAAVPAGLRTIYLLNPMATIVEGCRWSLVGTDSPWVRFDVGCRVHHRHNASSYLLQDWSSSHASSGSLPMSSNSAISVSHVSKVYALGLSGRTIGRCLRSFESVPVAPYRETVRERSGSERWTMFHSTSLPGEAVGIVGNNGAGKSTLLKILSRITPPTTVTSTCWGRSGRCWKWELDFIRS